MKCESCGKENRSEVKFCIGCGAKFPDMPAEVISPVIPVEITPPTAPSFYQSPVTPAENTPPCIPLLYQPPATPTENIHPAVSLPYQPSVTPTGYNAPENHAEYPPPVVLEDYENKSGHGASGKLSGILNIFKSLPIKKILMIGIPIIVIIIAAIIAIPMLTGPGAAMVKDSISIFYDRDQITVSGNNNFRFTIEGEYDYVQKSLDGSKAAVITDNRGDSGGILWFVTTKDSYRIAEDVIAYQLADSGNGVAYLTEYDSKTNTATLYLYDTSARKSVKITEDATHMIYGAMEIIAISPNGKSVSYMSDYNYMDNEFTGYIKVDGRAAERLGKNMVALAISDGGRFLYYAKVTDSGNASLYVKNGRSDNRLMTEYSGESFMLSRDYSQIIFSMDGKSYISRNGGEKEKIGGSIIRDFILPRGVQIGGNSSYATVYGVQGFSDKVIRNDDGLAYMNGKYDVSKIASTSDYASQAFISDDGKTLLYKNNNGHLSTIDPTKPTSERKEISRDVLQFVSNSNCKTIYFINKDNELFFIKSNGTPVKVSDDVNSDYLVMPYSGNTAFFLMDYNTRRGSGDLYFSNNGGRRVKVSGGDDITQVWVTPTSVFYRTIDHDVFRSSGNEKFTLLVEYIG